VIDLHTHSSVSDGTDRPGDLVRKAKRAGLSVVALTDHDTTAGWTEAAAAAHQAGIELVRGLEISVEDGGQGHHLLAYEPDPEDPALQEMLRCSISERDRRIPAMVELISATVKGLRMEDVQAIADGAVLGRPHLAEALVRCGAAPDRAAAFATYLVPGVPTYLETWSPRIEDAIRIVTAAGGVPVIAHPWGRNSHVSPDRLGELASAGLAGIEVDHQEHDRDARSRLRAIAAEFNLVVTGSSDYHGARKRGHDLGCNTTAEDQYLRLLGSGTAVAPVPATLAGTRRS
jgi:predicted metal-dependent phosphoesterase TrpH